LKVNPKLECCNRNGVSEEFGDWSIGPSINQANENLNDKPLMEFVLG